MKCYHTGLPQSMCGHCNGTSPLEKEPFTGRRPEDETPHLFQGRDKTEWRGRGETFNNGVDLAVMRANAPMYKPTSEWGRMETLRSVAQLIAKVGRVEAPVVLPVIRPRVVDVVINPNVDGQVVVGVKHKAPQPRRWFREGSQTMRHARKSGKAGAVLASVRKRIGE